MALAGGTSLLPALLALKVVPVTMTVSVTMMTRTMLAPMILELLAAFGNLLLPLLWGPVLAFTTAELLHEIVDHVLEGTTAATAAAASATSSAEATTSSTTSTEGTHHLTDELHGVLVLVLALGFLGFFFLIFLVGNDDHDVRSAARLTDFDKGVFMALAFLTGGTDVVVLADGALVADSTNGVHATAVAFDTLMDGLGLLGGHVDVTKVTRLHQFLENVLSLLVELIVYEVLNRFSWDALLLLGLLVTFGSVGRLLHLLVDLHSGSSGGEGADLGS